MNGKIESTQVQRSTNDNSTCGVTLVANADSIDRQRMYIPKHFQQSDQAELLKLIRDFPLATVIVNTAEGLSANHVPLILADDTTDCLRLQGHIPRANSLSWVQGLDNALAVFHGPNAYISPNWYATKQQHGKVVPTWNFTAVHASGRLRMVDDRDWVMSQIERLTDQQEATQLAPWSVADAPADFTSGLLASIIGIELEVNELHGKWKVSQNQPEENRKGVERGLEESGNTDSRYLAGGSL